MKMTRTARALIMIAMMVSGGPDCCDFNPVRMQYLTMINKAKKSIYIHSPYFIPDESVMDALSMAVGRGVDVRVIIPDKPDHMFVFWNNMRSAYFVMGTGSRSTTTTVYSCTPRRSSMESTVPSVQPTWMTVRLS